MLAMMRYCFFLRVQGESILLPVLSGSPCKRSVDAGMKGQRCPPSNAAWRSWARGVHFLNIQSAAAWHWRELETATPQRYQRQNMGCGNVCLMALLWVWNGSVHRNACEPFGTEADRSSVLLAIPQAPVRRDFLISV